MVEDNTQDDGEGAPNVGGLFIRFAAAFAENIGKEKTADVIRNFPEHLARLLSTPLRKRIEENEGSELPADLIDDIQQEVLSNPELASAVAIQHFEETPDLPLGKAQAAEIIRIYSTIANMISDVADMVEADIAVKGFFHDKDCISIWKKRNNSKTENFLYTEKENLKANIHANVYIFPSETVDADFSMINKEISTRSMSTETFLQAFEEENIDYYKVKEIDDLRVFCEDPESYLNPRIEFIIEPLNSGIPDMVESISNIIDIHSRQISDLASVLEKHGISIPPKR